MMKRINLWRMATIAVVAVLLLAVAWVLFAPAQDASSNQSVALLAPSFVSEANAAPSSPANFLVDEAGMSAYMKSSFPIDLATVRPLYRTIEVETPDYIIGSIPVTDHLEWMDVHTYVHKDGWIVGYYLNSDPVGKIYNWRKFAQTGNTGITTTLENTVAYVAGEAALPYAGVIYYDFRYPSATDLMLIVEYAWGTDSFQVNIPGSYAYSERCYSIYSAWLKIDGVTIDNAGDYSHGTLSATQLLPDTFHTIQIGDYREGYGGLAFVYRRP